MTFFQGFVVQKGNVGEPTYTLFPTICMWVEYIVRATIFTYVANMQRWVCPDNRVEKHVLLQGFVLVITNNRPFEIACARLAMKRLNSTSFPSHYLSPLRSPFMFSEDNKPSILTVSSAQCNLVGTLSDSHTILVLFFFFFLHTIFGKSCQVLY